MGLTVRETQSITNTDKLRTYFSVFDENTNKVADCGNIRDAVFLTTTKPGRYIIEQSLPPNPKVVDITAHNLGKEKQLNPQKILPENQQQPFNG